VGSWAAGQPARAQGASDSTADRPVRPAGSVDPCLSPLLRRGPAGRAALAAVIRDAEQALRSDPGYLRELAAWTAPPGSGRHDGVPPSSYPGPRTARQDFGGCGFGRGHGWGTAAVTAVPEGRFAGLACLLTTARDSRADWVSAGQALQRTLLTSAVAGAAAALHSQPLELARTRSQIRATLSGGAYPQMILRLGTVIQNASSVRRPTSAVMLPGDIIPPAAPR